MLHFLFVLRSYANFHDTHFLVLNILDQHKINNYLIPIIFDCKFNSLNFPDFSCLRIFINSRNSSVHAPAKLCQHIADVGEITYYSFHAPHSFSCSESITIRCLTSLSAIDMDANISNFLFRASSARFGIDQYMFLLEVGNASKNWTSFHDTHSPTIKLRFHHRTFWKVVWAISYFQQSYASKLRGLKWFKSQKCLWSKKLGEDVN